MLVKCCFTHITDIASNPQKNKSQLAIPHCHCEVMAMVKSWVAPHNFTY